MEPDVSASRALGILDWSVVAAYLLASTAVGLYYSRRAGQSRSEFFSAGRSLPWWLSGTSMVATTFAADTPLAVASLVAAHGVSGNWLWWNMVAGGGMTIFFFARLWRRAGVATDAELSELRYGGPRAAVLRGFRAIYLAVPVNLIIMGWVNLAMIKVLSNSLGLDPWVATGVLLLLTGLYSAASGLWGVVVTDFFQFILAMIGAIVLAVVAVNAIGGIDVLLTRLPERFGSTEAALAFWPDSSWMPASAFLTALAVQWWATWYPGSEPGGGGYVVQRVLASRTEADGQKATLLFTLAHYALRPWPWVIVGLVAAVLYPGLADPGIGYVRAMELLPPGLKGLMIASFGAAYMSTLSTQLNWGASYLIGDVWVRFLKRDASEAQQVRASRVVTLALFALSLGSTWVLSKVGSVDAAWRVLLALGAGTGPVYLLRWYWWRINAWSEVSAMIASLVCFVALSAARVFDPSDAVGGAQLMLVNTVFTTVVWVAVTLMTGPESPETLASFFRKVRPAGPGWAAIAKAAGEPPVPLSARPWVGWIASIGLVYGALFSVGRWLLGPRSEGFVWAGVAIVGALGVAWALRGNETETQPAK
jgi:Na+/proline symporter